MRRLQEMGLELMLHLCRKFRINAVVQQADAAVVVARFLLRCMHVHVVAEAHIVVL
jgi:hypothetical protein